MFLLGLFLGTSSALAGTAEEIEVLPTLDPLNRTEETLSNSGKWQPLSWHSSTTGHATGRDTATGWAPWDPYATINGAYWSPQKLLTKTGHAAAATLAVAPGAAENYLGLWLNMPSPTTQKSGYRVLFFWQSTNTYKVELSKWVNGTETKLASSASVSVPTGSVIAISDRASTVSAWLGSTQLLSAEDSTYDSGFAGIQGGGPNGRLTNFKAGPLLSPAILAYNVLDTLERNELPLSNGGKWSKVSWVGEIGGTYMGSYRGYGSPGGLVGAYWNQFTASDTKGAVMSAATIGTTSPNSGEYEALRLDMPAPMAERSGYEARVSGTGVAGTFKIELAKWAGSTRTVLIQNANVALAVGNTVALTSAGGRVAVWTGSTGLTPLLSVSDSTYSSGYGGLEVSGGAGTLYNFRFGQVPRTPDTTIATGPKGTVLPNATFSLTATEPSGSATAPTFECSLDGAAYATCSTPKSYTGLAEGNHTFKARATSEAGTDPSPAERTFKVYTATNASSRTPLLDDLTREEWPLATGKWVRLPWTAEIGGAWLDPYGGYGSKEDESGAYWSPSSFSGSENAAIAVATVGSAPSNEAEYVSLWLDIPNPIAEQASGYQARFASYGNGNHYVYLSKWINGVRQVLESNWSRAIHAGERVALTEQPGGNLAIWAGEPSAMTLIATANDGTYTSGYAGINVSGGTGTLNSFRAGNIDTVAPNTTISSGPTGSVVPSAVSFAFTTGESYSTFECALDAGAYAGCTSPKAYPEVGQGPHTFKVRATDSSGNVDTTPAERSFTVVKPPTVVSGEAGSITQTTATLNATVNPEATATTYQFEYGPTTAYGTKVPATAKSVGSGSTAAAVSEPISGLSANTTFHFRISATNVNGTSKGADKIFSTVGPPSAITGEASGVSAKQATLNASVNPKGAATTFQFEYGMTTGYGTKVPVTAESIGSGMVAVAVSKQLTSLVEGATYHFRVVASSSLGTSTAADETFYVPYLPNVVTEGAEAVEPNDAIVNAEVDSNGEPTTYSFQYGTTTSYGSVAPSAGESVGEEGEPANATDVLDGLKPSTTYHYRVLATSEAGVVTGPDKTFTTDAATVTPQYESELEQERTTYTGKLSSLPAEFFGMMWNGPATGVKSSGRMNAVMHSGAKMFRLVIHPNEFSDGELDKIFQAAANRDIRILPYFYPGNPVDANVESWSKYIRDTVERLGPNGKYWGSNEGKDRAATTWEIGNEPNLGSNTKNSKSPVDAKAFGDMFAALSAAAKNGANNRGQSIDVLLAGLFTTAPTGCDKDKQGNVIECHMDAPDFIRQMGHDESYDGVSIHPYVFKVNGHSIGQSDVANVKRKVYSRLLEVRHALEAEGEGNKPTWVTEIGWPVGKYSNQGTFPPVSEELQQELINATFNRIEADHNELGVKHLFYYNLQDDPGGLDIWDTHTGLRKWSGKNRQAWKAYANQAGGDPNWAAKPGVNKRPPTSLKAKSSGLTMGLNNDGAETVAHFQYWKPAPKPNVVTTSDLEVEGVEAEQGVTQSVTGLLPKTEYVYHGVATNDQEDTTVGENESFTTPPSSSTTNEVKRRLYGRQGYVWVTGRVREGFANGSLPGLSNVHVHVKILRSGVFQQFVDVVTNGEGFYDSGFIPVGNGDLETQSEFPGGGEWDASSSEADSFHMYDGVQLVNKNSGKCMDIEGASTENGAHVMHGECHSYWPPNQIFSQVPVEGGSFLQLQARHSGRCVDVAGASTDDQALVHQWDCGPGTWQQFQEEWSGNYVSFKARHSGKCLDVQWGSTSWAPIWQWPCNGTDAQKFQYNPVDSGPIPTQTTITMDQELHGSPGWMTFHGRLEAGAYSMANRVVHVEFDDRTTPGWDDSGGHFTFGIDGNNFYAKADAELKPGYWNMRARFMGDSDFAYSESGVHELVIRRGNHFVNRYSDMCLSLSQASQFNYNGQPFIQWPCSSNPSGGDGQVFSFWPQGNGYYNLLLNGTHRCVDVAGGSTDNHAQLRQWDCGPGDWQEFDLVPVQNNWPWEAFIARHSGKCIDNTGPTKEAGTQIFQQYECNWTGGQQWRIDWVIFP
jgi:hypothetical protein